MNRRIKQVIIGFAICIGLFIIIVPKIIGIGIQQAFNSDLLDQIPAKTNDQIIVTNSLLENGWFQSFISLDIEYNTPELNEILFATVEFDIEHGPLILNEDETRIGLANANIKLNSKFGEPFTPGIIELPSVFSSILIGLNQSVSAIINISPLNFKNNSYSANFGGLNGEFVIRPNSSANANISAGELHIENATAGTEISISGIEIKFNSEDLSRPNAPSDASIIIPMMATTDSTELSASDIYLNFQVQTSDGSQKLINISQNLNIGEMKSDLPLTSLSWASEINEIQNEIFENYNQIFLSLQSQGDKDPMEVLAQTTRLSEEISLLVVQNNLVLNNSIQAVLYGGEHNLKLKINWKGLPNLTNLNDLNFKEAISAIDANLNISLDRNAIENSQFSSLIDQYIEENYLVDNGSRLVLNGELHNNELIFNDTTTLLEEFFQ